MKAVLILVVALAGACWNDAPAPSARAANEAQAKVKQPAQAKQMIGQGAVVIDVRSPEEFESGHLPNAVNYPVQELPRRLIDVKKLTNGDVNKPIVVYCGAGSRAGKAKLALEAEGYTQVVNGGGYTDLK